MDFEMNLNICRVCLKSKHTLNILNDELRHKYEYTTKLQLREDVNMPTYICNICSACLRISYNFVRLAIRSERKLNAFLIKTYNEFQEVVTQNSIDLDSTDDDIYEILEMTSDDSSNGDDEEDTRAVVVDKELIKSNELPIDESPINMMSEDTQHMGSETDDAGNDDEDEVEAIVDTTITDLIGPIDGEFEEDLDGFDVVGNGVDDGDIIGCADINTDTDGSAVGELNLKTELIMVEALNFNESKGNQSDLSGSTGSKKTATVNVSSGHMPSTNRPWCNICNRDFSTKTNLKRHMHTHAGKKSHECEHCGKVFSQKSTLKQHIYTHTGEKPFVCKICDRRFTQTKTLVVHMRRHTGDKPFSCDFCGLYFRQKDGLKTHILKHHANEKLADSSTFACTICKESLADRAELKAHMKKHINNHPICEPNVQPTLPTQQTSSVLQSDAALGPPSLLDERLRTVSATASSSTRITATVSESKLSDTVHIVPVQAINTDKAERVRKYQCRKCFKCFAIKSNLIEHLTVHDIWQCQSCELIFNSEATFKLHQTRMHKACNDESELSDDSI